MTGAGALRLVARREIEERVRSRSFRISLVVMSLGVLALILIPGLLRHRGPVEFKIGVVTGDPDAVKAGAELAAVAPALGARVSILDFFDRAGAEQAVRNKAVAAVLVSADEIVVREEVDPLLGALARETLAGARLERDLAQAGIAPERAAALAHPQPPTVRALEPPAPDRGPRQAAAFIGAIVLYISIISFGLAVANGVVEEKSSRIVEVLLSTVRPIDLLAGKIAGIGLIGLLQLVVVGGVALVGALSLGAARIPRSALGAIPAILVFFLVGFLFYACVFGAAGASVSRQEEIQNVTMPLNLVLLAGYFIGISASSSPESPLARVASLIPPLTPLVMPSRIAAGGVAWWEVGLSLALTLAAALALIRIGARLYTGAILRTGPRVRLRDAWRGEAA